MNNLTNRLSKTLFGISILLLPYLPLSAQNSKHMTGESIGIQQLESHCRHKKNIKSGRKDYKNIELTDYCKLKPAKNISSNKYTPQYWLRKNKSCGIGRYEKKLKRIHRRRR